MTKETHSGGSATNPTALLGKTKIRAGCKHFTRRNPHHSTGRFGAGYREALLARLALAQAKSREKRGG